MLRIDLNAGTCNALVAPDEIRSRLQQGPPAIPPSHTPWEAEFDYRVRPIPNLLFMRDPASVIGDGYKPIQARSFEPPGLGPDATTDAIGILILAWEVTGDAKYLAPIGKAAAWLKAVAGKGGTWHRYYDPETNRPVGGGKTRSRISGIRMRRTGSFPYNDGFAELTDNLRGEPSRA